MPRVALQADLWYNEVTKNGVVWDATNITRPRYKIGACTMSNIIPSTSGIYKITCNEKLRQTNLGKKPSPQCLEAVKQANTGKKHTSEYCEVKRQSALARKRVGGRFV